jgi:DNA-binding Lrp family transcriptional regulator
LSIAAYIVINTALGRESDVINSLKNVQEVKEAHSVYGVYDIVARLEAENLDEIRIAVSKKIRNIQGVNATSTLLVI